MSGDRLNGEHKRVIEKEKPKEKLKADNGVTLVLPKIPTILDDDKYEKKKEIKKQEDDEIKDKIDLQMLTDKINQGNILSEIEFYFRGPNPNYFQACANLGLKDNNSNFIDFLGSDLGSQILRVNMLSIYIETGNIFYDNYNANDEL